MATGYTYIIEKGGTFKQYALRCARAFGYLMHMRDDALDKPISFPPVEEDSYHAKELKEAQVEWAEMLVRSEEQWEKLFNKTKQSRIDYAHEDFERYKKKKQQYAAMKAQVSDWNPPSTEHENLKKFMLEQIHIGGPGLNAEYYLNTIQKAENMTLEAYRQEEWYRCKQDIQYHTEELAKETKMMPMSSQEWVELLEKSL